jgi:membrane protein DedA with SNARE-associated domain
MFGYRLHSAWEGMAMGLGWQLEHRDALLLPLMQRRSTHWIALVIALALIIGATTLLWRRRQGPPSRP